MRTSAPHPEAPSPRGRTFAADVHKHGTRVPIPEREVEHELLRERGRARVRVVEHLLDRRRAVRRDGAAQGRAAAQLGREAALQTQREFSVPAEGVGARERERKHEDRGPHSGRCRSDTKPLACRRSNGAEGGRRVPAAVRHHGAHEPAHAPRGLGVLPVRVRRGAARRGATSADSPPRRCRRRLSSPCAARSASQRVSRVWARSSPPSCTTFATRRATSCGGWTAPRCDLRTVGGARVTPSLSLSLPHALLCSLVLAR